MHVRPYRLLVTMDRFVPVALLRGRGPENRGARTTIARVRAGYVAWSDDQTPEPARLPGSGTFLFAGALRAVARVHREFRDPRVVQVSLRTNQDRTLLVYNRQADGRITHYSAEE